MITRLAPWGVLPFRLVLFAAIQTCVFLVAGTNWAGAAAWWPLGAVPANIATVVLLVWLLRREGRSYRGLFALERGFGWRDFGWGLALTAIVLPLAILPNILLAQLLFGDAQIGLAMLLQPLPPWAVALAWLFPLTIAFAELPLYFGYAMPRLEKLTGSPLLAVSVSALFLSLQHVTLPLLFDAPFVLWRALMFLPLALVLAIGLRLRPSLLPMMAVVHALLDTSVVVMLATAG